MDEERAARLAAMLLALRSGGAQTMPNANPAALAAALRGAPGLAVEDRPEWAAGGRGAINPVPVQNHRPAQLPPTSIGVRG